MARRVTGVESIGARLENANNEVTAAMNAYRMALLGDKPAGALEARVKRALTEQFKAFRASELFTTTRLSQTSAIREAQDLADQKRP